MLCLVGISCAQTITTFPYFTSFEGAEGNLNENFPEGWVAADGNPAGLGNSGWEIIKNSESSVNAHTDSTAAHVLANFNVSSDDWFFTPPIQMSATEPYSMTFWYKTSAFVPSTESMEVYLTTDATSASVVGSALWNNASISNTTYQMGTVDIVPPSDGVYRFAFHSYSAAFEFVTLLDDVTVYNIITAVGEMPEPRTFRVWPNPMDQALVFVHPDNTAGFYALKDAAGRSVEQFFVNGQGRVHHAVDHLPSGVYFLQNLQTGTYSKCMIEHR